MRTIKVEKDGEDGKYLETNFIQVPYIWYPITFWKKFVWALFNSSNEINTFYPTSTKKLGFSIKPTDIEVQKIDRIMLNTYKKVIAAFLIFDKANQVIFFTKFFLAANVCLEVVLKILFLTLSNIDINILN